MEISNTLLCKKFGEEELALHFLGFDDFHPFLVTMRKGLVIFCFAALADIHKVCGERPQDIWDSVAGDENIFTIFQWGQSFYFEFRQLQILRKLHITSDDACTIFTKIHKSNLSFVI